MCDISGANTYNRCNWNAQKSDYVCCRKGVDGCGEEKKTEQTPGAGGGDNTPTYAGAVETILPDCILSDKTISCDQTKFYDCNQIGSPAIFQCNSNEIIECQSMNGNKLNKCFYPQFFNQQFTTQPLESISTQISSASTQAQKLEETIIKSASQTTATSSASTQAQKLEETTIKSAPQTTATLNRCVFIDNQLLICKHYPDSRIYLTKCHKILSDKIIFICSDNVDRVVKCARKDGELFIDCQVIRMS